MALAATTLISASSVFAADTDHAKLQEATEAFEKVAVASGKLKDPDVACWGKMKDSLGVK